jgi:metallo-beta-lactamase family protein
MMKLTFHGGAKAVTGANYLLETENAKILVDCGLTQGAAYCDNCNFDPFPYNVESIDAVLVTHAHIDHTGRLPFLVNQGFRGTIYSTAPTRDFAKHLLTDSVDILAREAKQQNLPPVYTKEDVRALFQLWKATSYHKKLKVKDIVAEFFDAGHILGSSFITVTTPEKKRLVFSGDLGNCPNPLLNDTEPIGEADYILTESTYGGRLHEDVDTRTQLLQKVIEETIREKGVLMIPAFAMERTQQLLFELNEMVENGRIPRVPVFLDSPLAIKLTAVYKKYSQDPEYFDPKAIHQIMGGDAIFQFPGLEFTRTKAASKKINNVRPPKIIIAGSGMSNGGRIIHHERRYLEDPNNTILFIGYQAADTLGRQIFEGAKSVTILEEEVAVNCSVRAIGGYSAHADQPQLLDWLATASPKPQKVFVVQGEEDQATALAQKIKSDLFLEAVVPSLGDQVTL